MPSYDVTSPKNETVPVPSPLFPTNRILNALVLNTVRLWSAEHVPKAELSIVVTVFGIVISRSDEHPLKALAGICVRPVKYCNSSNDVICVLFRKVVPNCELVTCAAWLGLIPVPSPQFVAQICSTVGSTNTMYASGTPSCVIVKIFAEDVPWWDAVRVMFIVLSSDPVLASEETRTVWSPCDAE